MRKLDAMSEHHFVSKSQQRYLADLKAGLRKGHCVILAGFLENYSVVIQDEVQGYHWTKDQITVHPFVAYFVNESDNQQAKSFVRFSENLRHNTVAVFSFQKRVMESLKTIVPNLEKIYYFSDGAASQYKNSKNFSNLRQHDKDFGVAAEWHFFGTSHGKNACDGVGGTVKRLATRASIQMTTGAPIPTAKDLFAWAEKNITGIQFFLVGDEEIRENEQYPSPRLSRAKAVRGYRSMHCFKPLDQRWGTSGPRAICGPLVRLIW